jgi:hypothetical protein
MQVKGTFQRLGADGRWFRPLLAYVDWDLLLPKTPEGVIWRAIKGNPANVGLIDWDRAQSRHRGDHSESADAATCSPICISRPATPRHSGASIRDIGRFRGTTASSMNGRQQ